MSRDARERLAAEQAALVLSLVAEAPFPEGFDQDALTATRAALARKQARTQARRQQRQRVALDHPQQRATKRDSPGWRHSLQTLAERWSAYLSQLAQKIFGYPHKAVAKPPDRSLSERRTAASSR